MVLQMELYSLVKETFNPINFSGLEFTRMVTSSMPSLPSNVHPSSLNPLRASLNPLIHHQENYTHEMPNTTKTRLVRSGIIGPAQAMAKCSESCWPSAPVAYISLRNVLSHLPQLTKSLCRRIRAREVKTLVRQRIKVGLPVLNLA